jgi:hypothetical protein
MAIDRDGNEDRSSALGGMIARHSPDPGRHETVSSNDDGAALDMTYDPFARDLGNI